MSIKHTQYPTKYTQHNTFTYSHILVLTQSKPHRLISAIPKRNPYDRTTEYELNAVDDCLDVVRFSPAQRKFHRVHRGNAEWGMVPLPLISCSICKRYQLSGRFVRRTLQNIWDIQAHTFVLSRPHYRLISHDR